MSHKIFVGSIAHIKRRACPDTIKVCIAKDTEQSSTVLSVVSRDAESHFVVPESDSINGLATVRPCRKSHRGIYEYVYRSIKQPTIESVFIINILQFDDEDDSLTATSFMP